MLGIGEQFGPQRRLQKRDGFLPPSHAAPEGTVVDMGVLREHLAQVVERPAVYQVGVVKDQVLDFQAIGQFLM